MTYPKLYVKSLFAITMILIMVNPMAAAPVDAYGGYVSDNRINEGDRVVFSGTFHNFLGQTVYVASFNISFVEILGPGATTDPSRPNISRQLDGDRRNVPANGSYTDTLVRDIDFSPGAYNVTIFFEYSNSSNIGPGTSLGQAYSLINASFAIEGITQAAEVFRYIGIALGVIIVAVIGILVYSKYIKKY